MRNLIITAYSFMIFKPHMVMKRNKSLCAPSIMLKSYS